MERIVNSVVPQKLSISKRT
ncbi:hypothetical protein [Staphylococcus epidermidis]